MLSKIKHILWGDLTKDEVKKFGMLSFTFLFIIGTYWLMRPLKDGLFMDLVGPSFLPYAKMLSFAFIVPLILVYSKLVDLVEKQKLFYVLCSIYGVLFASVAFLLSQPAFSLNGPSTPSKRLLGWCVYLAIESFGSLLVTLFWSFVASSTDTTSAKRGYALIISGAQIGSITGPYLATNAEHLGLSLLTAIVAGGILLVPLLIKTFITLYPSSAEKTVSTKPKTGPVEGLRLLLTKPYLLGVLGVATLYEIIGTVVDYQLKFLAKETYGSAEKVTQFLGYFGLTTNALALVFSLIGTTFFINRYGLTFCLVMYPVSVALVLVNIWALPGLWVVFVGMVAIKGFSYALNNPCKEIMYIPTSKDVKFKAKGWIDMFGSRSSKAAGASIGSMFPSMASLALYGPLLCMGIVGFWIMVALYVGRTNKKLVDSKTIIE